jgi:hypothetical protein
MGSGDPSGLQNRRELALLALVSSTLTRFRQHCSFPRLRASDAANAKCFLSASDSSRKLSLRLEYNAGVAFAVLQVNHLGLPWDEARPAGELNNVATRL